MSCPKCGQEDHHPGDICWGAPRPEGYVGIQVDILRLSKNLCLLRKLVNDIFNKSQPDQVEDKLVCKPPFGPDSDQRDS